jgi:ABC-type transporter Mla subunit MlaD
MAARANYVKLGLFVILGLAAAIALAIFVGVLKTRREIHSFVTYFGEAVQGLEVGAPVKARGVTVGRVGKVTFAPDHQMIEVRCDLDVATLEAMGVNARDKPPANVRVQLASLGLLGGRFLSMDFFDPKKHPPPVLSFTPATNYIPATPSLQKSLQDSAVIALDRLAQVMDALVRDGFTEKLVQAVTRADDVFEALEGAVKSLDQAKLGGRAAGAIEEARTAMAKITKTLEGIDGESGLVTSAQRALGSFSQAGRSASATTRDLEGTLDEIRAAAGAIRSLAEELERNPDMLVKGRGQPRAQ